MASIKDGNLFSFGNRMLLVVSANTLGLMLVQVSAVYCACFNCSTLSTSNPEG